MAVRAHVEATPRRGSLRGLVDRASGGEHTVAAILDGMSEQGWLALHEVATPHGTIDHVVVGPAGVFVISTSAGRGRISVETIDERTYVEPYALARRVEAMIGHKVTPVLVYSQAKLSRDVSRQRGVMVVMAKTLAGHLDRRRDRLASAEVNSLYHQLVGMSWAAEHAG
jgi:hypothetical protein